MAGARDGKLTLMISGPAEVVEGSTKLLGLLGNPVYVGDTPGAPQTVKNDANLAMMRLRDGQVTGRVVLAADGS
jgi:3-hydroxyisobutyrate dehydrogenase